MEKKYILLTLLCFFIYGNLLSAEQIKFKRVSPIGGFGIEPIKSVVQDTLGMIWFCSTEGLFRYNANEFKAYHLPGTDNLDLSNENFEFVYEDSSRNIWIGTSNGLYCYDRKNDCLLLTKVKEDGILFPIVGHIRNIVEDEQNRIWILWDDRLGIYDISSQIFREYPVLENLPKLNLLVEDDNHHIWIGGYGQVYRYDSVQERFVLFYKFGDKIVNDIIEDSIGRIWIATEGKGLYCVDSFGCLIQHYEYSYKDENSLSDNLVRKLLCDDKGNIWIGTYRGLNLLDNETQQICRFDTEKKEDEGLPHNSVFELYMDQNTNLWIGTWSGGLALMSEFDHKFDHFKQEEKGRGLSDNVVSSFAEDSQGNLWIGTERGGLNYWDRFSRKFEWFLHQINKNSITGNNIKAMLFDPLGSLWIATHGSGLCVLNPKTGQFKSFIPQEEQNSLAYTNVYSLESDSVFGLWIGTSGAGLDYLDFETNKFSHYRRNLKTISSLKSDFVQSLLLDHDKDLWVGTIKGLSLFDTKQKCFKEILLKGEGKKMLEKKILFLYEDSSYAIWIGTDGSGLFRLNPLRNKIESYAEDLGLEASRVYGIVEDKDKNLWISTSNGIFCRFIQDRAFVHFDQSDGLQSNQFSRGAVCRMASGELVFGGTNGFNVFNPAKLQKNNVVAQPLISAMTIYNQVISPQTHPDILKKDISITSQVILNYTQKSFGFEFCYPSYLVPQKNKFRYMLDGEDNEWYEIEASRRSVTYSNLSPGNYIFHLQASNNDGIWSPKEAVLKITVLPAPWLTWWAFSFYVLFCLAILWGVIRFYWLREKQKNLMRMEKEKAEEVNQMKLQFFANVSHEFRTPLTLILGPVQQMLKDRDIPLKMSSGFQIIDRNTRRLLHLVNQLMDFMKLEKKGLDVVCICGNIAGFINGTGKLFSVMAANKNIDFIIDTEETGLVLFDKDKIEKILFNLLSNAFKFTSSGGFVTLSCNVNSSENEGEINLSMQVSNSGSSIPSEVIPNIFLPYYQHTADPEAMKQGTGIGLALTKELVTVLGGEISVKDDNNMTIFKVKIPLRKADNDTGIEFVKNEDLSDIIASNKVYDSSILAEVEVKRKTVKILIAEDNMELLDFLEEKLNEQFYVIKATDGKKALEKAVKEVPDVIISDIMMPEMNGLDLCRLLKANKSLTHIPVILLTARTSNENQIEGLNCGADAYIQKPFDTEYLIASIRNLYRQRKELRKVFGQKISVDSKEINLPSEDEQFLKLAASVVEKYMENEDFNVAVFAQEMGMGKTLLYQKMKSIAGMSVNEFILNLRMSRAKQLLRDSELNIAQIAVQVGFKNPNYFSTCFKNQFKMSPKKYYLLIRK